MKTVYKVADDRFSVETYVTGSGEPLLFLHGAGGLIGFEPFLDLLGERYTVYAPHLPGYGESTGGEFIEDVFDAALFYHQLMDELGIPSAHIVGHSMGAMLAAETAALDTRRARKLVLASAAGFWLDRHPIADLFATPFNELAALIFHDPKSALAQALTAVPDDQGAILALYLERMKRLGMASRFLWPIPERGLGKRAYRIAAPTLLIWGESDRLIPPAYAEEFLSRIRNCRLEIIREAGHMVMYERPQAFVKAVCDFLAA